MARRSLFIGTIPKLFKKFLIFGFMSWSMRTLSAKSRMAGMDPSKTIHRNARTAPALEPLTPWTWLRSSCDIWPRNA